MTLEYVRFSFFSCIEKKGKFGIPCRILSFVLLRCWKTRPIKGLSGFVMTKIFPLKVKPPFSNCNSAVAKDDSNCLLAGKIWYSGGGPSSKIAFVCGANNRVLRKSASGMAIDKTPVSISLSMLNARIPLKKK